MKIKEQKIIKKTIEIYKNRWFIFFATGFFIVSFFLIIFIVGIDAYYKDKILPRVRVNNIVLAGKTFKEGMQAMEMATDNFMREGIFFKYKNKEVIVPSIISSTGDPDLSKEIFSFDLEKAIEEAYSIGRKDNPWVNVKEKLVTLFKGREIELHYYLNNLDNSPPNSGMNPKTNAIKKLVSVKSTSVLNKSFIPGTNNTTSSNNTPTNTE